MTKVFVLTMTAEKSGQNRKGVFSTQEQAEFEQGKWRRLVNHKPENFGAVTFTLETFSLDGGLER